MCYGSFICAMTYLYVPCLIHMCHGSFICAMTHSYVPWLIHMWHDSFIRDMAHAYRRERQVASSCTFTCAMPHSYVTWLIHTGESDKWLRIHTHHDSSTCAVTHSHMTWLIHTFAMTHLHVCHDSFTCVPWLIYMCAMTHLHVCHDSYPHRREQQVAAHSGLASLRSSFLFKVFISVRSPRPGNVTLIKEPRPSLRNHDTERWGAGVETQKNVRGEIGGWGRVPFNETYAPSLSTIYDGA